LERVSGGHAGVCKEHSKLQRLSEKLFGKIADNTKVELNTSILEVPFGLCYFVHLYI